MLVWGVASAVMLGAVALLMAPRGGSDAAEPPYGRADRQPTRAGQGQDAEAAQRSLAARLLDCREDERRLLARDLHDELGPCLFGLSVMADGLRRAPDSAGETAREIETLVARIRQANGRILTALRPAGIGRLPLSDVITELVAEMSDAHPGTRFRLDIAQPLPPGAERLDLAVYRILQEGMTNALRHGRATVVEVRLRAREGHLDLEVTDDGRGLASGWTAGRGLEGMRDRVAALRGQISLSPCAGSGTRLRARVPLGS